ncbi:MAG: hypothetical protein Q4C54_03080 [Clostridia bacterium]|nr:hypothetical protein [Clostridia bacterium]
MEKKRCKGKLVIILLLIVNLCATAVFGTMLLTRKQTAYESDGFLVYVGLTDKDAYTQVLSTEEAKDKLENILSRHLGGYTIIDATGGWLDETNTMKRELTLMCVMNGTDIDTVHKVCDDIFVELNVNTVLIEQKPIHMEYYSRK